MSASTTVECLLRVCTNGYRICAWGTRVSEEVEVFSPTFCMP